MQISLNQRDIELSLKMYLASQGIVLANRPFEVDFTAGRKGSGISAEVNIGPAEAIAQAQVDAVVAAVPEPVQAIPDHIEGILERETPEVEAAVEVALAAELPIEEDPPFEEPASVFAAPEPVQVTPPPIFTPEAEVPVAAPAAPVTKPISLFA